MKVWRCEACGGWNDLLAGACWRCGKLNPARAEPRCPTGPFDSPADCPLCHGDINRCPGSPHETGIGGPWHQEQRQESEQSQPAPLAEADIEWLWRRYQEAADEATLAVVPDEWRQIRPREFRRALLALEWLRDRESKHEDYAANLLAESAELKRELARLRIVAELEAARASADDLSAAADRICAEAEVAGVADAEAIVGDWLAEIASHARYEPDVEDDEIDDWLRAPFGYPDPATLEPTPGYVLRPHAYDCHTQLLRGMLLMQAERWVDVWGNELDLAKMPDDYAANLLTFLRENHAAELPELERTPLITYLRRRVSEAR